MIDSGHWYEVTPSGIIPKHDTRQSEALKAGYYGSVTSKLKIIKNFFIEDYRRKGLVLTAESTFRIPGESDEDYVQRVDNIVWKQPVRWDGVQFQSNDFGKAVHAELEKFNRDQSYQFAPEWAMYCTGWRDWFNANVSRVIGAEMLVADQELKVAGSIDFVGVLKETDRVFLADYKTRELKGGIMKSYDDDLRQLAIESDIVRRELGLPYLPAIFSCVIDILTGQLKVKEWKPERQAVGIKQFTAINHVYNVLNGVE